VGPVDAAALRAQAQRPAASGPGAEPAAGVVIEVQARLAELQELGLYRRTRLVSGPQGPRVVLDGRPALLLCSNNYLGLADSPRVQQAAAQAATRWGVGAGASRLVSGTMTVHRRLEKELASFKRTEAALLFGSATWRTSASSARSRARARSSSQTSSTTRRSSTAAGSRARRRSSTPTTTSSTSRGAWRRQAGAGR
jgi:glycine C-acetyltransferase/8-amino-7-oxononanoate synthase